MPPLSADSWDLEVERQLVRINYNYALFLNIKISLLISREKFKETFPFNFKMYLVNNISSMLHQLYLFYLYVFHQRNT